MALGNPGGDDPHHPGMPLGAGQDVGRALPCLAHLRLGLEQDAGLDVAPLGIGPVELVGPLGGPPRVLGGHQPERGFGAGQAAGAWWSVTSTSMPAARAAATADTAVMAQSTVTRSPVPSRARRSTVRSESP